MNATTTDRKFSHLGCLHPTHAEQFAREIQRARLQGAVRVVSLDEETRHGRTNTAIVEVRKGCRATTRMWATRMLTFYQSL